MVQSTDEKGTERQERKQGIHRNRGQSETEMGRNDSPMTIVSSLLPSCACGLILQLGSRGAESDCASGELH